MPWHDYGCPIPDCTELRYDRWEPPICETHLVPMEIRYLPKNSRPFESFVFDSDQGPIEVTSLHQVREIERTSMEAYKAGRGRPFCFRVYSQDHHKDENVFQALHPQTRREDLRTRSRAGVPFLSGGPEDRCKD
jgi:hypothetical protein